MTKNTFVGAMLATTVALSALVGCAVPSPATPGAGGANPPAGTTAGTKPGTIAAQPATTPATNPKAAAAQNGAEIASAMSEEREAEDYNALAADGAARYNLFVVGAPKPKDGMMGITGGADVEAEAGTEAEAGKGKGGAKAGGKATVRAKIKADVKAKLDARLAKLDIKRAARLAKHPHGKKVKDALAKAAWVDNGDGTKTKSVEFTIEKTAGGKTMSRSRKMVRTVDVETGALVKLESMFSHTAPNGAMHSMTRTKTLNEDGTYSVVFHSEIKHKNGTSRVCDWTKTIAVDGTVTGTGTITWKDAAGAVTKTSTITLGGTEEEETATSTEGGTSTTVEAPVDGEIEVVVTDPAGTTPVEVVEGADGTIESSTEAAVDPAASPAPAASTSPAAEASPAASESPAAATSPAASESPAAAVEADATATAAS